jgi:hypothetical protein
VKFARTADKDEELLSRNVSESIGAGFMVEVFLDDCATMSERMLGPQ